MEAWTPEAPPGPRRAERVEAREVLARAGARTGPADPSRLPRDPTGTLVRRVESVWRAKVPARLDPAALRVDYAVGRGRADAGTAARGGRPGAGGPEVQVIPETPRRLCGHGRWQLVEGGARLEIDLSGLEEAGRHSLSITVRLDAPR